MTHRVVVIGAGGYAGATLLGLLLRHPGCDVAGLFGSERAGGDPSGTPIGEVNPAFRGLSDLRVRPTRIEDVLDLDPRVAFLATPHEASAELAPPLLRAGVRVFDLSGAFRLDEAAYPAHYGFAHPAPDLLRDAVYGLVEHARAPLAEADLVALPGCYPTASLLALKPLVDAGAALAGAPIIIDAVSGVSGAGRASTARTHFCEVSLRAYGVFTHRHHPEIERHSGASVVFTPHVAPFKRGLLATVHVRLAPGWSGERVGETFGGAYRDESFVRLLPRDVWPGVGAVEHTNFCDLAWAVDESAGHLIVEAAIDNLMKGAAGQAVQAFNVRFEFPETTALEGTSA